MSNILMSLSIGTISMIIVFVSGLVSGLVRIGTLTLRSLFAFCLASAASYFLIMLFDMYGERQQKEIAEINKELAEGEESEESEEENSEQTEEGFKPMNAENLPNAEQK